MSERQVHSRELLIHGQPGASGLDPRPSTPDARQSLSPNQRAWRRFQRNRPAIISAWLLALIVLVVIAWPAALKIASFAGPRGVAFSKNYQPDKPSDDQFLPPSAKHWFGTDVHGRDLLSRALYGAQISLLVGIVGAGVSLVIGVLWGAIAGYAGGRVDSAMM